MFCKHREQCETRKQKGSGFVLATRRSHRKREILALRGYRRRRRELDQRNNDPQSVWSCTGGISLSRNFTVHAATTRDPKFCCLRRHIHRITARRRPEIDPACLVSPFLLRHARIITAAPSCRDEPRAVPPGLNPRAVPGTAVV